MHTIDKAFAEKFAQEWVASWNTKNLDAVLVHYRDDFIFSSPLIAVYANEPSGVLTGKIAIRAYWENAIAKIERIHFELQDMLLGANSITLYYRGHRGLVAETFVFDAQGLVKQAMACYSINN